MALVICLIVAVYAFHQLWRIGVVRYEKVTSAFFTLMAVALFGNFLLKYLVIERYYTYRYSTIEETTPLFSMGGTVSQRFVLGTGTKHGSNRYFAYRETKDGLVVVSIFAETLLRDDSELTGERGPRLIERWSGHVCTPAVDMPAVVKVLWPVPCWATWLPRKRMPGELHIPKGSERIRFAF